MNRLIRTSRARDVATSALAVLAMVACNDTARNTTAPAARGDQTDGAGGASQPLLDATTPTRPADAAPGEVFDDTSDAAGAGVLGLHTFHQGGVTHLLSLAMDTLGLPPERQGAVLAIQRDLDASTATSRVAEKQLLLALADGVAGAKTDDRAVNESLVRLGASVQARVAAVDAMNRLYALLTPVERGALADKVLAHADIARDANDEGLSGGGRLATLAAELALSADQVQKARAELRVGVPAEGSDAKLGKEFDVRVRAFAAAFAGSAFDAKSLAASDATDGHFATIRATRMAHFIEVLTPLLTSSQRSQLALRLRERADDTDTLPAK